VLLDPFVGKASQRFDVGFSTVDSKPGEELVKRLSGPL
jgi:hypothetical protein